MKVRTKKAFGRLLCLGLLGTLYSSGHAQDSHDELDALIGDDVSQDSTASDTEAGAGDSRTQSAEGEEAKTAAQEPEPYPTTIPVAQREDPVAESAPPPRNRLIEEIVVTAQKREENLKDVPISVTAFSAGKLDAKGVFDAGDLPKLTPGLTITTQVGFTSTFLRGVGSDAFILGDPSVVTYVDGVYFPFALGQVQDFGAIERIEVLKGPQGTLFGRNALGGAIKIETKRPALDAAELSFQTLYATFDTSRTRIHVSVPVFESLAISASGFYNIAENHVDGRHTADFVPLPKEQSDAVRFQAFWQPADWFEFLISYYDLSQDAASTYAVNTRPSPLLVSLGEQPGDPRAGRNNEEIFYFNVNETLNANVRLGLPWFDVKLFGSDQYVANDQSYDFDGTAQPLAGFTSTPGFADVQTAELQILSSEGSPGSDWLEWILGVYYFKSHAGFDPGFLRAGAIDLQAGTVAGLPVPGALLDLYQSVPAALPAGAVLNFVGLLDTESVAYFAQATAELTPWASFTLGARFQSEERVVAESSSAFRNSDGSSTPIQSFSGYDDPQFTDTTESFDPKVSLNFRPGWSWLGDEPLLYLNYQSATTSSTFNTINIYDPPERVDGSKITAYELGYKSRLFDGLLDLNAAAFHYEIDTPQVQIVSLLAGGAVRFENAGGQEITGVDFDALIPLFDGSLVMTLSGAYLDTKYTSYTNGSGFDEQTSAFSNGNDYTGNPIVRAPEFSGTIGLLQTIEAGNGVIELGADYYHNGGFYYLAQSTPSVEEKAYGTLAVSASYLYEPWNLRLTAFGRNVLDEEYNLARFRTDFGTNDTIAPLATYGIRLNYDF